MNLMKFHIWLSFENLSRKFKFNYNATKITYTLPEYVFTFIKISCWILFGKGNVSDESCRVNRNKHSLFTNISFFVVQTDRQTGSDDNTIRHMRFVCWITKATDTLRIRNILWLDMCAMGIHCCVSMAILNSFILLAATCTPVTIKGGTFVAFLFQQ